MLIRRLLTKFDEINNVNIDLEKNNLRNEIKNIIKTEDRFNLLMLNSLLWTKKI